MKREKRKRGKMKEKERRKMENRSTKYNIKAK
jgi:hypothetical protein